MSEESAREFLIRLRHEPAFEKEAHHQAQEGKVLDWIRSQGYYFSRAEFAKVQQEFGPEGRQAEEGPEATEKEAASSSGSGAEEPPPRLKKEEAPRRREG